MLSLVVTALLVGLVASDPSPPQRGYGGPTFPIDPYRGPQYPYPGNHYPVVPGGNQVKVLTVPKVHREQVGLIHQEAVPVPETRVVTNERVKVVTQKEHVLVPKVRVQKIVQQIPLRTIKKVVAPVLMKHKEIVPVIQTKVNTVVKEVPKIITKTLVRNIPRIKEVPRIHTKHVHHVKTKVVHKAVPSPFEVKKFIHVPKPFVQKSPVPMEVVRPKYIDRVHVQTKTQLVPKPMIRNVVHEKPMIKTEIKTVQNNVPVPHYVPKHFHHTKVVNKIVPKIQTVVQERPVPKIITQTHVKKVQVPFIRTQTIVKKQNVPVTVPKIIDRVQTVQQNVPVNIPIVQREKVPVLHREVVPHVVTRIQPKIQVRDRIHTVHRTHIKKVPQIVKQLVPHVKIQKVIQPRTQVILKETHKEIVRPVKMASRSSVRYYQIQGNGQRVPITQGHVQELLSSGRIRYNDIGVVGGPTHAGAAGIVTGASGISSSMSAGTAGRVAMVDPRIRHGIAGIAASGEISGVANSIGQQRFGHNSGVANNIGQRYGLNSGQVLVQNNGGGGGFSVGGQAGGPIGMINMQSEEKSIGGVGGAAMGGIIAQSGAAQQAAAQQAVLHAEAAMINNAARQSAMVQHGGAFQHPSQYAGIHQSRYHLPRSVVSDAQGAVYQNLNKNSNSHILAKVANA
ncbi:uncharacterized protein LOC117315789 isoform X27 [Pecten maximus]|uniref:uncharacterized protein LOC117315789 isoform X27 n=1 Tax=Pecten maximus TaxID=6579 RepID=UPI001457ECC4|nr:uncharacterized protein LOC117315789 isoform X27 [Pecten maximus]